ncbi:MAG: hypothetical protein GYB25_02005 [Rhodobacteraceae bacterium]|nr:hypothetical protein [Paracoccaceae bacterium]
MLANSTQILINETGHRKPIEELQIGDLVFDPFADQYGEITNILSKELDFAKFRNPRSHHLYPVVLRAGSLGPARPSRNVAVSPGQEILAVQEDGRRGKIKPLRNMAAKSLVARDACYEPEVFLKVQYFAIFTEFGQYLDASDLLIRTFGPDVFDSRRLHEKQDMRPISKTGYWH